jgi:hypothetical protein
MLGWFHAFRRGLVGETQRWSPEQWRTARVLGPGILLLILGCSAVMIAQPWGRETILWVVAGMAVLTFALLGGVLRWERRRSPLDRSDPESPSPESDEF